MTYTPEQNKAFEDYLIKQGKTTKTATKEDALAFLNPTPVIPTVEPTKVETTKPLIKTDLQTWKETIVWTLPVKTDTVVTPEPIKEPIQEKTTTITPEWKKEVKPTTTTDITYKEDKTAYDPNKVISKAEQFTWTDWKTYQTVRNSDNTLTTIDVTTWQPVTWKYTDAEREWIKQSFLWWKTSQEIVKTSNDYYSMLWQGLDIPIKEKNTIEYKKAFQRKANLDKYSVMNSTQLAWAIKNWEFLPWTQEYNDLKQTNPKLVQDAETLHSINAINEDKKDITDIRVKISEYLTKLMSDDDKTTYKDKLSQNPTIVKLNEDLWEKSKELASIKDSIEYATEDFEKQLWWKAVTSGYKRYKLWEMNRELTRQYNSVLADYNSTAWQIKTLSEDIKYEMETEKQDEQNKLNQLSTAYNIYQWLTEWERQIEQIKNQRLYQVWDMNSQDEYLRNLGIENAVNQLYTQYPIPWMELPAIKIQKAQDLIAQWYTPQQAISQLEQEIRNTDRYKNYIASQTPQAKSQDLMKMWEYSIYDPNTWKWIVKPWTSNNLTELSSLAWKDIQCWKAVNTYIQEKTWNYGSMWDTLDSKITTLQNIWESEEPMVWWVFVSNPLNNTVWHTWIVENVNPDWSITTIEANADWKKTWWPLERRTYTKDQVANMMFSKSIKSYNENFEEYYKKAGKLTAEDSKIITKEFWSMENFQKQAIAFWKEQAKSQIPDIETYLTDLEYLKENAWSRYASMTWLWYYDAVYNNVIAKTSLNNLINLKNNWATFGALSNQELNFITNASDTWKIKRTQWEDTYKSEIDKLIASAKKMYKDIAWNDYITQNKQQEKQLSWVWTTDEIDPLWLFSN